MVIIADTSPLIAFAILGRLDILDSVFNEIRVPLAVYTECTGSATKPFSSILEKYLSGKIYNVKDTIAVELLADNVDIGEAEAIILARELGVENVLMDDKKARVYAKKHRLHPIGTVGTLLQAKKIGYIFEIKEFLDKLIVNGYRISNSLYSEAIRIGNM